jgi:DNA-binding response OmpR family regulator
MKKLKLLLVDDEKEFVETLADRLKMRDLDAAVVHDGEQALSAVEQEEPDVIVLDLKMPGIDGIEVLRRVRSAYPNVQVSILTGHGSKKDEDAARTLGAYDYLKKPVDLDTLVPRIKDAFKQKMRLLERMSMAVAFAEAGEFDTAKEMMEEEEEEEGKNDQGGAQSK